MGEKQEELKKKNKGTGQKYLIDSELPLDKKAEIWVGRHYKHILIFSLGFSFLTLILSFFLVSRIESTLIKQSEIIRNISSKVVFVSPDGRVAVMEKNDVTNPAIKNYLRDFLRNIIVSGFDFKNAGITNEKDVLKLEKINNIMSYFTESARNNLTTYLVYTYRMFQADKLPEIIYISGFSDDRENEEFIMQNNQFIYNVNIRVATFFVLAGKWWKNEDKVVVFMKGKFDISKAEFKNPFGLIIEQFEVRAYPEKKIMVNG